MAGMDTIWGADHLERSQIWSTMIKEALQDDLEAQGLVNWISDFPDGAQFNISSIGELTIDQMEEGKPLPARRPDTGQFNFQINHSLGNKAYYTDEFMEDDFLAPQVVNATPKKMKRALDEFIETEIFKLHNKQTLADANSIRGYAHRYSGGNSGAMELQDYAYAKLSLKKANVPQRGLVGFVDPAEAYRLETLTNLVDVSNNPRWEGIVQDGIDTGMRFIKNIYGIDIYESNYLDVVDETIDDKEGNSNALTGAVCNLFFAAGDPDINPFMGAWRRMPTIESWRDHNERTEYYQLTARLGLDLYRHENLVTVLSPVII